MEKVDAVKIWKRGSREAMITCGKLYETKRYDHALFFLHLSLEKLIKAVFVHKNDNSAPYIHNLADLAQRSGVKLALSNKKELASISEFNVSARYESYKYKIHKLATKEFTEKWIKIGRKYYRQFMKEI